MKMMAVSKPKTGYTDPKFKTFSGDRSRAEASSVRTKVGCYNYGSANFTHIATMGPMNLSSGSATFPRFANALDMDNLTYLSNTKLCESRAAEQPDIFRLHFRRNRQQITRYIPSAAVAAEIRRELDRLQSDAKTHSRLREFRKEARVTLRNSKHR